jgi:transcriptional regulator with XRE-family HTH domain
VILNLIYIDDALYIVPILSEQSMKTRIQKLIEKERLTPVRFAEIVGVQRSSVSHILSGRNNPGLEFIQKILLSFPTISSDWLVTGQGDMYKGATNAKKNIQNEQSTNTPSNLFSSAKEEDAASYSVEPRFSNISNNSAASTPIPNNPVSGAKSGYEGFQKETATTTGVCIEKIVVFYSDSTFREYSPQDR